MSVRSALLGVSICCLTVSLVPVHLLLHLHMYVLAAVIIIIAVTHYTAGECNASTYNVLFTSYYLSLLFVTGFLVLLAEALDSDVSWRLPTPFIVYSLVMVAFHWTEYVFTALNHTAQQSNTQEPVSFYSPPPALSWDSFLLNHSTAYTVAAVASWMEFALENWLWPAHKQWSLLCWLGLLLCIGGDVLRKCAMCTAGEGFTHLVSLQRRPEHQLCTNGVYAWSRHPGYVGWFYWSIGTQIILKNPLCTIVYAAAAWVFFEDRVKEEELFLIGFFGQQYLAYKKAVPTGLPFIYGYSMSAKKTD